MTKGSLANKILSMLGINTRFSEATPEEVQDTLGYLEDWMLANNAAGRRLGYIQSGGTPDPEDEAGIPDWAVMGVTASVAIMCAPYFGKQAAPELYNTRAQGMATISMKTIEAQPVQYPGRFPKGQAQSGPFGQKYYHPEERIVTGGDFLTDEGDEPITT